MGLIYGQCILRKIGGTPASYGRPLGSNPDISQKYKMGDIRKGVPDTP
jgi:hypothetical protein